MAQTFTAGLSGPLTKVELGLKRDGAYNVPTINVPTISIFAASGGIPVGSALASKTLTTAEMNALPTTQAWAEVTFATPATVTAGNTYAITITASTSLFSNNYLWYIGGSYAGGNGANKASVTWVANNARDFAFRTYVDATSSDTGPTVAPPARFTLSLDANGGSCTSTTADALDGDWAQLPTAQTCSRAGSTLLGWSTSATFPRAIAQRHAAMGWGTFDGPIDSVRTIFVPTGSRVVVSGENRLFAIWS